MALGLIKTLYIFSWSLNFGFEIGTIDKTIEVWHKAKKERELNSAERFYIYKETQTKYQLNDKFTAQLNTRFTTFKTTTR
jgi:hypothetical protein